MRPSSGGGSLRELQLRLQGAFCLERYVGDWTPAGDGSAVLQLKRQLFDGEYHESALFGDREVTV